ncbi:MAG: secretin, partial [Comamonadaceae bacterium BICA1-1]
IEVRSLLQVIADFTDFNIIASEAVTGSLTMRLQNVPWDQALDTVLQAKNLGQRRTGNVIWVAPNEHIIQRERLELQARVNVEALEPLRTQFFALSFAKAPDVQAQLMGVGPGAAPAAATPAVPAAGAAAPAAGAAPAAPAASSRILSNRGSVNIDTRTNQVFVTDVPSGLERVADFIRRIDVPVSQVLIEARIVRAEDTFGRSLGVRLGGADMRGLRGGTPGYGSGTNRIALGASLEAMTTSTRQLGAPTTFEPFQAQFVNFPARALGAAPATLAATLFSPSANRFLNLEISALQADGRGQVVASPRVITTNQNRAIISQGVELPFTITDEEGRPVTSFRAALLRLEVTPQVTPDGGVSLKVIINKDSRGEETQSGFAINTRRVETEVLVENGGTVVIGGIFETEETNTLNQVPGLGELPVLGHLFRSTARQTVRRELLVFLTPQVLTTGAALR